MQNAMHARPGRCDALLKVVLTSRCVTRRTIFTRFSRKQEHVEVPVGGRGHVRLDITQPINKDHDAEPSVLVHLPSGPALSRELESERFPGTVTKSLLEQLPQCAVVTINYRLSSPLPYSAPLPLEYRYPQPIHDVCVCFAELTSTILPDIFPRWSERGQLPRIYVTGSHIGGGLATTLALTEVNTISGVSVSDPLIDWCMFDEHAGTDSVMPSKPKKAPITDPEAIKEAARIFLAARTRLFSTPSAYFDPFASPVLFLRAPGRDTPRSHVEALGRLDYHLRELKLLSGDAICQESVPSSHLSHDVTEAHPTPPSLPQAYGPYDDDHSTPTISSTDEADSIGTHLSNPPTKRYKVLRRWPPNGRPEDVLLPRFRIQSTLPTGIQDGYRWLLHRQATELADYLRRACFWGRERSVGEERVQLSEVAASAHEDTRERSLQEMIQADFGEEHG